MDNDSEGLDGRAQLKARAHNLLFVECVEDNLLGDSTIHDHYLYVLEWCTDHDVM